MFTTQGAIISGLACAPIPRSAKILTTTVWNDTTDIQATGSDIEKVDDFCNLGSYISHNGSCEKDVRIRIGKATAVFGKMRKIWKNKFFHHL